MRHRIADALGKAAVAYPFLIAVMVVVVAFEANRGGGPTDLIGWMLWSVLWVGIAAFVGAVVVVPILAAEFLLWGMVARRIPWLDASRAGLIVSSGVLGLPWALAPQANGWGAAGLMAVAIALARTAVPALGVGAFNTKAGA